MNGRAYSSINSSSPAFSTFMIVPPVNPRVASLFRTFSWRCRRFAEFLAPDLAGTSEFGFFQLSACILNQRFVDTVALQLIHDPACAKTSAPPMNNALDKSLIR